MIADACPHLMIQALTMTSRSKLYISPKPFVRMLNLNILKHSTFASDPRQNPVIHGGHVVSHERTVATPRREQRMRMHEADV